MEAAGNEWFIHRHLLDLKRHNSTNEILLITNIEQPIVLE